MTDYDEILETTLSLGEAARILAGPAMEKRKFIRFLQKEKMLNTDGIPYARYVNRGYFLVVPTLVPGRNGVNRQKNTTRVTVKGLSYIGQRLDNYLCQYMERQMNQPN